MPISSKVHTYKSHEDECFENCYGTLTVFFFKSQLATMAIFHNDLYIEKDGTNIFFFIHFNLIWHKRIEPTFFGKISFGWEDSFSHMQRNSHLQIFHENMLFWEKRSFNWNIVDMVSKWNFQPGGFAVFKVLTTIKW